MNIKETLFDGYNGVDDNGDVVPLDRVEWQPAEASTLDHYRGGVADDASIAPSDGLPIKMYETGASVNLVDRAIAIEAIMGYFNQANKDNGLRKSRGYNGFDARYGRGANEVARNMTAKENRLYAGFMRSVASLVVRDGMVNAGFSSQDIDAGEQQLIRDLYRQYGPGNATANERAKLTRRVNKTVRMVVDGKKR